MTFIIAEIGSNFRDFDDCVASVKLAAQSGADAVKFQYFSQHDLYGDGSEQPNIPLAWLVDLKQIADEVQIEFMCTAFSPKGVEQIDPLVRRHKIASSEMEYQALLQTCLATEKPVLISTGGHTLDEILKTVESIRSGSFALLYCCNAYPSRQHNLFLLDALRAKVNCPVGYSDHTIDLFTPFMAATYFQAPIIEKHVTLNRDMGSPDAAHSITFPELFDLVKWIREGKCSGDFITPEQWPALRYHNRRKTENGFYRLRS